jgi:uncharacterized protein
MHRFYFDTSALAKYYHAESGSEVVRRLANTSANRAMISKLTTVEFHSASARKVRTRELTSAQHEAITRQFDRDRKKDCFRILRLTVAHFNTAEALVRRHSLVRNLRTLDALQLAVALSLNTMKHPITFVCSDVALCEVAAAEGLAVLNPETV